MTMMLNLIGAQFLVSHAPPLSNITLVLTLLTALAFTVGWQLARRKHFTAHRWVQTITAVVNAAIVLIVMVNSYLVHILPGIPSKLLQGDYAVTTIHALVGAIGLVLGLFVVLRANRLLPQRLWFSNYKLFMRTSYALYMLATLFGVVVYIEVYILGI